MSLKNVFGSLVEAYAQVDPNTISSTAEIMKETQTHDGLGPNWFWVLESAVYTVEDGEAVLRLTEKLEDNLIFQNIKEATRQLLRTNNYIPEDEESIERIIDSVEGIKLSDLELEEDERCDRIDRWACSKIDLAECTSFFAKYKSLNPYKKACAEKICGKGKEDFKASIKLIKSYEKVISFYVLHPDNVKKHVKEGGAIIRACKFGCLYNLPVFFATEECVHDRDVAFRGQYIDPPQGQKKHITSSTSSASLPE